MNTRTLVATFKDYSTARQASRDLQDLGVPADAIHVDSNQKTTGAGWSAYHDEEHHSGFTNWWKNLFESDQNDEERQGYEGALAAGNAILRATVSAELLEPAVDALNRQGAADIQRGTQGNVVRTGEPSRLNNNPPVSTPLVNNPQVSDQRAKNTPIPVVEEELQVGKRSIQRGGVRVYSHVVTEPVEQQIKLREEHVKVERRPVDREASPEEMSSLRDQTIEVTEMAEEPVVGKRARVREEVVVGKQATERTETVRDNIRHTQVEVEQLGNGEGKASGEDFTNDYRTNFRQTYGPDADFDEMQPSYEFGSRSARDARYDGRSWDQAENDLRSDYESAYPQSRWDRAKSSIRYGWERATGKR